MDYLTNYYKNLCGELQEKLNILEAQYSLKPRTNIMGNAGAKYDSKSGTDSEMQKLERKVSSKDYFKVDDDTPSEPSNPATIIPRKPATKDQPIVPEPKPETKDKIKNFIRMVRDVAKPGEKIKKTPSKILYRDEETPYIERKFHDSDLYGTRKEPTLSPEDMKRKDLGIPMTDKLRRSFGETKPYIQ